MNPVQSFLKVIDPLDDEFVFVSIDPNRTRGGVIEQRAYPTDSQVGLLEKYNQRGYGIYFTVNQTSPEGRKAENVTRVRAVFLDWDEGADLNKLMAGPLEPHIVTRTREDRLQAFWLTDDVTKEHFTARDSQLLRR